MNYYDRALELKDEIIANRRYIHTNAEVGLHMPKAKAYVIEKLRELNLYKDFEMILINNDNEVICTKGLIEKFELTNDSYTLKFVE